MMYNIMRDTNRWNYDEAAYRIRNLHHSKMLHVMSGKSKALVDLTFYEAYMMRCLTLMRGDYLGSRALPATAYRAALSHDVIVPHETGYEEQGADGYHNRQFIKQGREKASIELDRKCIEYYIDTIELELI